MSLEDLDVIHKRLRRYKYFYYELHQSVITDYKFDLLEKEYVKECKVLKIPEEYTLNKFVGFNMRMPMSLLSFREEWEIKNPQLSLF